MQRKTRTVCSGESGGLASATVAAIDGLEAMWAAVKKLQPNVQAVRPPASFTVEEYCARYRISRSTAEHRVGRDYKSGALSRVMVALPNAQGRVCGQWCYTVTGK